MIACPTCAQTYSPRGGGHCGCCHRTICLASSAVMFEDTLLDVLDLLGAEDE